MAASKSKFFRVCTEGATTDGRNIERAWIEQMAKNFDRQKYGARVWLEHVRGVVPGSPFDALGDVTAVQARPVEDGKLALFAQIEPLPALVQLNKSGQKIYTSAEITPKFADTGEAYLSGLGVTDSPASLGVEVLQFAATHAASNPFTKRKSSPDALFSEALPLELELEDAPAPDGAVQALIGMFTRLIPSLSGSPATPPPADKAAPPAPPAANLNQAPGSPPDSALFSAAVAQLVTVLQTFSTEQTAARAKLNQLQAQHDALVEKLSQAPAGTSRPPATGSDGYQLADC